jgi:predicted methyltransferase
MKQPLTLLALVATLLLQTACEPNKPAEADAAAVSAGATEDASGLAVEAEASSGVSLESMLAGEHRSEKNAARDIWRHPVETLEFFGVEEDSTVMEIWPGGGWYTEVLAPYLRDNGTYIAAGWDPESEIEFIRNGVASYQEKLDANPDVYDKVKMAVLMPPEKMEPVSAGSIDVIVTFRNVHNWMPRDAQGDMLQVLYNSLKPGGVLGVVEHRGNVDVPQDPQAKTGYVNEQYAIDMIEAAGFVLDGKSEVNANSADTKDHPEGVWTLPPTSRLKEQDQDKYLAIGESDRFTLRFVKPVS